MRFSAAELAEIRKAFRQRVARTAPKRAPRAKPKHDPKATRVLVREPEYDEGDILTTRHVADVVGVSTHIVRRWAEAGMLPSFRTLGGHRQFRWEDVRRAATP